MKLLVTILNLLLIFAAIWLFVWSFTLANRFIILHHQDSYAPGTLVVDDVRYFTGEDGNAWYAYGTVRTADSESPDQRLALTHAADDPGSRENLLATVPLGTTYDVWFNPDVEPEAMQGETLRVILDEPDFWDKQRAGRDRLIAMAVVPFVVVLILRLIAWRADALRSA